MNNIVPMQPAPVRLVAGVRVPHVSPWLRDVMDGLANPHPDAGADLTRITDEARTEAARLLPTMDAILTPANADDWRRFMAPARKLLPKAPNNVLGDDGKDLWAEWCGAAAWAMTDMPAAILTEARRAEAATRFKFWPTPNELSTWLAPCAAALRAERRLMARIAETEPSGPEAPMTQEVREAFSATLKSLKDELLAQERARYAPPDERPKTAYLTPDQSKAAFANIAQGGGPFAAAAKMALKNMHGEQGA